MKGIFFAVGLLFLVAMIGVVVGARDSRAEDLYPAEIAGALWAIAAMLAFNNSKGQER